MAAAAAARHRAPWKQHFDVLRDETGEDYARCIRAVRSHPQMYTIPAPCQRRPRPGKAAPKARTVMLSTGTIVVCPVNLVQQWMAEISKHTKPGTLQVLTAEDDGEPLPSAESLLEYDIVLLSRSRFDKEGLDFSSPYLDNGKSGHVPYCKGCPGRRCNYRSTLRDIHWKRIIVDEVSHRLFFFEPLADVVI